MPLFYRRIEVLSVERHGALKIDRNKGFGHAARSNVIPLGIAEIAAAAARYPIVFTAGPEPVAVAIVGCRGGQNLFVDKDGAWRPGAYVPGYVRAFPFIFVEQPDSDQLTLAVESDAECLGIEVGAPLFDGQGRPTSVIEDALGFCGAYRESALRMRELALALDREGLLIANQAVISMADGETVRMDGFRVVDEAKLDGLPDTTFLEWRRLSWLTAIYAQLQSRTQWSNIVERATAR